MTVDLIDWVVITVCVAVIVLWVKAFPYPSILIRWLLPPKKRWPEAQIRGWLLKGSPPSSYLSFFNRDPERIAPAGHGLVAPADGLVTSLECRNGIRYVVIALTFWDVHVQRSPEAGRVSEISTMGSEFMDGEGRDFAFLATKASPVQMRIVVQTAFGQIAIRLITSFAARRLESFVMVGESVVRGQRIGKIMLGSTVVLEIPERWSVLVREGGRVRAGETLVTMDLS
ncbi:phosphatidylserine decarboxylase [Acidihalobacter aeolianus]|uniref:phosphatidylserine decarboxylase n=1 Tax=Acidihalobacter aeolianus TaxID=2792603 RepID=UPI0009F1A7EE|nr:phosphatidylserine decarboxylase [Acidihalobacter aeolianus]